LSFEAGHGTFEEYCWRELGHHRDWAYKQISAAEIVSGENTKDALFLDHDLIQSGPAQQAKAWGAPALLGGLQRADRLSAALGLYAHSSIGSG
jgi:hypothetical protein